ncbi:MAG TPA: amidohydrolase [Bacillota bacterium]
MKADIIIHSRAVFTGLNDTPEHLSIAIKGNKIIGVDTIDHINFFKGKETKIIDVGNKLVMPGFHDSHLHLMAGVLFNEYAVSLAEAETLNEALETLKKHATDHPSDEWVIGIGWDHTAWGLKDFPNRFMIDDIVSDRPVFLLHAEGHYAWVNSKALEMAGITSQTDHPEYGIIYKDKVGDPTGILIEAAISLVGEFAYHFTKEEKREMLQQFLNQSIRLGVTSVNDFYMSRAHEELEGYDVYEEFDRNNQLTVRIHVYPPLNGDIEKAKNMRETFSSSKLQVPGLKQFIDGVVTGYTAFMLDPYEDNTETKGELSFPSEQLQKWVIEADKEGFQIRFHSIGDGAVRLGLDLFEQAQKENGKRDSRHALEHIEVISPQDIPRFKKLGVLASVQPSHLALMPRESHTEKVSQQKLPYLYPNSTLLKSGAIVPYSSDYPIVPLNPMLGIFHAVTRMDYSLEKTWNEQEKLTLSEALKAYTKESAYSVFRENELGTIEKEKLADIVILDRNLFDIPEKEILDTKVEVTIMDGKIVWRKERVNQ